MRIYAKVLETHDTCSIYVILLFPALLLLLLRIWPSKSSGLENILRNRHRIEFIIKCTHYIIILYPIKCITHLHIMANVVGILCGCLRENVALELAALALGALLALTHRLGAPSWLRLFRTVYSSSSSHHPRILAVSLFLILAPSHYCETRVYNHSDQINKVRVAKGSIKIKHLNNKNNSFIKL